MAWDTWGARKCEKMSPSVIIWCRDLSKKIWSFTYPWISKYLDFSAAASKKLEMLGKSNEKARLWSRDLLDFPLGLPGISGFFEAAGLKSRYFAIQRDVKPQIFFGRSIHHNKPLGLIFSCSRGFTSHRAQPPRLAPPESTYSSKHRQS